MNSIITNVVKDLYLGDFHHQQMPRGFIKKYKQRIESGHEPKNGMLASEYQDLLDDSSLVEFPVDNRLIRIEECVGDTPKTYVYRARDVNSNQLLCVKILKKQ